MNRNLLNRSASAIFLILILALCSHAFHLRPNLHDEKPNSSLELSSSVNKQLNGDETSFLQILRRAIYMDLKTQVNLQDKNQTFVSKLKTAVHNSIIIQILICLFSTVLLLLLIKSKLSPEGSQQQSKDNQQLPKNEDTLLHEKINNPFKAEEEEKDIIRMTDFNFEDFLNRIQSTSSR